MTRAFDVRHGVVGEILSPGILQTVRQLAAKDAGRRTILAWFSETSARGRNLWHLPEVHQ